MNSIITGQDSQLKQLWVCTCRGCLVDRINFIIGNAISKNIISGNNFPGYDVQVCVDHKLNSQEFCNFYVQLTLAFMRILYIFSKNTLDNGQWCPKSSWRLLGSDQQWLESHRNVANGCWKVISSGQWRQAMVADDSRGQWQLVVTEVF